MGAQPGPSDGAPDAEAALDAGPGTARDGAAPTGDAARLDAVDAPAREEARTERARALFATGVEHTRSERWSEAARAFEDALALRDAPAIRYNLAAAQVELGRYREAADHLARVAADPETPPRIAAVATELEARLGREAGRLRIERAEALADTSLAVDARPVDAARAEDAVVVAPGAHVVTASRGPTEVARARVDVAAGERTHVFLGVGAGADGAPDDRDEAGRSLHEEWGFWLAIGAGVVAVGVLVGVAAATASGGDDAPVEGDFVPGVITWD